MEERAPKRAEPITSNILSSTTEHCTNLICGKKTDECCLEIQKKKKKRC